MALFRYLIHLCDLGKDELVADSLDPNEEGTWQLLASFLVEIQETQNAWNTQVVHRETDTREEWNGIAIEEVGQWMLRRIGHILSSHSDTDTETLNDRVVKPLPPAISLTLEIQHLRLLQPSTTQTPKFIDRSGRIFPDPLLNSNQRFSLEIYVSVPELESELESVELGDRPLTYRAQCYLRNLTDRSSASSPFAETPPKPLSSGRSHYAIVLPELQLSRGIHLLQVLVLLQDRNSAKPVAASSFELPWLQVL